MKLITSAQKTTAKIIEKNECMICLISCPIHSYIYPRFRGDHDTCRFLAPALATAYIFVPVTLPHISKQKQRNSILCRMLDNLIV